MATLSKKGLKEWAVGIGTENQAVLAIGFTDIAGSTVLNRQLGDERMSEVRDAHFAHSHMLCQEYHGYVVKTLGDGLLVAFHAATHALDFLLALRADTGHELVTLHAGLYVGPVVIQDNDVFGTTVNYTARLEGAAKRDEILVSASVKAHIDTYGAQRHMTLQWAKRIHKLQGFDRRPIWAVQ